MITCLHGPCRIQNPFQIPTRSHIQIHNLPIRKHRWVSHHHPSCTWTDYCWIEQSSMICRRRSPSSCRYRNFCTSRAIRHRPCPNPCRHSPCPCRNHIHLPFHCPYRIRHQSPCAQIFSNSSRSSGSCNTSCYDMDMIWSSPRIWSSCPLQSPYQSQSPCRIQIPFHTRSPSYSASCFRPLPGHRTHPFLGSCFPRSSLLGSILLHHNHPLASIQTILHHIRIHPFRNRNLPSRSRIQTLPCRSHPCHHGHLAQ